MTADRSALVLAVVGVACLGITLSLRLAPASARVASDAAPKPAIVVEPVASHGGGAEAPPAPRLSSESNRPAVNADVRVTPYTVRGHDAASLLESLRASGPRVDGNIFFGLTTTSLQYRYATHARPGRCETSDARVDLVVTITLPEWTRPAGAPFELTRDWSRFAAALRRHEEQHRDLAIEQAHALRRAVDGLSAPTCDAVADLAASRARLVQDAAEVAHRAYDARTGHGETEGAVWPPRAR